MKRPYARRVVRKIERVRGDRRLSGRVSELQAINEHSTGEVTGAANVIVSMTTHGARTSDAYLALESVASGSVKPRALHLWLDDPAQFSNLPSSLRRLQARGLQVHLTANLGPHTKYYPALSLVGTDTPLATADDDVILPPSWLEGLLRPGSREPKVVHCYRAHRVRMSGGRLLPYAEWGEAWDRRTSFANFPTGVSGVLYPPALLRALQESGEGFLDVCPKADDIWLHKRAVDVGIPARQVGRTPREFPTLDHLQGAGLLQANVLSGGNDVQAARTYSSENLRCLELASGDLS